MDKELAQRVHALLSEAFALEPEQRKSFVVSACQADQRLQRHMTHLLSAIEGSGVFMQTPVFHMARRLVPPPLLEAEQVIGNYRLVRVIGMGGMATVYEAIQSRPERRVALKIPRDGWSGTQTMRRFRYETEALARLQHPGIAQIYEAGTWDAGDGVTMPFFAMEFIADARTITEHARDQDMRLPDRLAMFTTVCDAVHYGHQRGVIHRDLKPANILVDTEGRPKVIDFGIAGSNNASATWTSGNDAGQLVGTLNYMSPEQCAAGTVPDVRADVYSLGVVLYELIGDRLPHDLAGVPIPEALRIVQQVSPPRLTAIDPRLRRDLDAIVLKSIEKEPDRRYHSVDALVADIRRYLHDQPVEARPPSVIYQCRMFARRNRGLVGSAFALLCVILVGSALISAFAYRALQESKRRMAAEAKALGERDTAVWQAYIANIAGGFAALQTDEFQQVRRRLAMAAEPHRGWEWHYLQGMAELSETTIAAHDDMIFGFDADPTGTRWVTGCRDGSLRIWNASTGKMELSLRGPLGPPVRSVAFSPDGQSIVSGSEDRAVHVWDAVTGQQRLEIKDLDSAVISVCYGPNGVIMAATDDGVMYRWDRASGALMGRIDDQPGGIHGIEVSHDGTVFVTWNSAGTVSLRDAARLDVIHDWTVDATVEQVVISRDARWAAAGGSEGHLVIWNIATGETELDCQILNGTSTVRSLNFSQEGDLLAAGQIDRTITVWSVPDGERVGMLPGHEEAVSALWFPPGAETLVSTSWDGTIRTWRLDSSSRLGGVSILAGHDDTVRAIDFSPSGEVLATGSEDHTVRLWDPELGLPFATLRGHQQPVYDVAFSPDGRRIATSSIDRTVRLWDAATGQRLPLAAEHAASVWSVAFSPDGTRLASAGDDAEVRIWNIDTGRLEKTLSGHAKRIIQVAFNPTGTLIASASRDHTVRLWDASSGQHLHTLKKHRADVFAVVFSHNGDRLYSGSRDQTVCAWDPVSGACLDVFEGHGQFVTSLALSPNGKRLAAGSWFGEIVLWDLPSGDQVASFKGHGRAIRDVAFSPDGRFLASASMDASVHLYDSALPRERRESRRRAQRSLLKAESLVADLFQECPEAPDALRVLAARSDLESETRAYARQLILQAVTRRSASP